jgi:hypothetical protein
LAELVRDIRVVDIMVMNIRWADIKDNSEHYPLDDLTGVIE